MIKSLQRRFIIIAMLAISIVTCSICGVIIVEDYMVTNSRLEAILDFIIENDGKMPEYKARNDEFADIINQETEFSTRYFYVKTDEDGNITEVDVQNIAAVNKEQAEIFFEEVFEEEEGFIGDYKYKIVETDYGKIAVFLECSMQINNIKTTSEKAILVVAIGLFIVFIFIFILSKRVLSPIIKNIEKQKQFITNAGHELKTPIAVIMANADILEMTSNENLELIESIKNQSKRLDILSKSLLNLANVEEKRVEMNYSEFSITEVIKNEIIEFGVLAQEKEIIFDEDKDVMIKGDITTIRELITILLDNAIKYTEEDGKIEIVIEKQGKSVKIQIANTCENAKTIDTNKLFDRFYRDDKSRSQLKEGYGIGLSIAKSIVEMHKGKITAETKNNMIYFTIII